MSQENVEIVRRFLDAFNRGDRTAWLVSLDEDYEIIPSVGLDLRAIRGGEAGWNWYLDIAQTLSVGRVHTEYVDAGADKVLGHLRHEARGRISGAPGTIDGWVVTTLRDGKILRDEWFTDRADALEAAGLEE